MERHIRWIAFVGLCLAALIAVFLFLQAPVEPEYSGQKLTTWLGQRSPSMGTNETRHALQQMGDDAFPYMLLMMRAQDKPWARRVRALLAKQRFIRIRPPPPPSYKLRWEAARGFALLGPNASPAVPGLTRLLHDPDTASQGAYALLYVQSDDAWRALAKALDNSNSAIRQAVAIQISSNIKGGEKLIPALVQHLRNSDSWVRENCARALGRIREEPESVVPALIVCLSDSSPEVVRAAAAALSWFGDAARPAVTALQATVARNDPTTHDAALTALKSIEPTLIGFP